VNIFVLFADCAQLQAQECEYDECLRSAAVAASIIPTADSPVLLAAYAQEKLGYPGKVPSYEVSGFF
jgi:hypothetical protein